MQEIKDLVAMKGKIKTKLRIDDEVIVVCGKNRGKRGKILSFLPDKDSVLVQGINMIKKTVKKSQENKGGGFTEQESPIHISNVMYYSSSAKKGVRLGWSTDSDGKKERVFRKQGERKVL